MPYVTELLIAIQNVGKFREIESFFRSLVPTMACRFLKDLDPTWDVAEDGRTFLENATKKAVATATQFQKLTLADDSGLLVDVLNDEPGVHSSRYAGPGATDSQRIVKLLERMKGTPSEKRNARFECVMVLSDPSGACAHETGILHGIILDAPRGEKGFGFDPVFWIPSLGKTLAELEMGEKNKISHRAQALHKISTHFPSLLP
jgi:XTP/dITP diphosphohydrolase